MDERGIEQAFESWKREIAIDAGFKQRLRRSLLLRQRLKRLYRGVLIAAAAVLLLLPASSLIMEWPGSRKVEARALQIQNQTVLMNVQNPYVRRIAQFDGTVYVPMETGGLYAYAGGGAGAVLDRPVREAAIDPSGGRLLFISDQTLGIYDLKEKSYQELLGAPEAGREYADPGWRGGNAILYTERASVLENETGRIPEDSVIYELDLATGEKERLAEGASPSYAAGKLVYEKWVDNRPVIMIHDLRNGRETVIGEGRSPSVSPNGLYVAYVKPAGASAEGTTATIEQVVIADADGASKRIIDSGDQLPQGEEEAAEGTATAVYSRPEWADDASGIYIMKRGSSSGRTPSSSLLRIELSPDNLGTVDTVRRFNEAVMARNDQYAGSLMLVKEDFLIMSNPHMINFTILGDGVEKDRPYVDAEMVYGYTAQPYTFIQQNRYYLTATDEGWKISEIAKLGEKVVVYLDRDGSVVLEQDGREKEGLFRPEDLPGELRPEGTYRLASIAYLPKGNQVLAALQLQETKGLTRQPSVRIVMFDVSTRSFRLLQDIQSIGEEAGTGIESLFISADERYAALDLYAEGKGREAVVQAAVLDLGTNRLAFPGNAVSSGTSRPSTHTLYWERDKLHFSLENDKQSARYVWDAGAGTLNRP